MRTVAFSSIRVTCTPSPKPSPSSSSLPSWTKSGSSAVRAESAPGVLRRDRAGFAAVAGQAGAAVAAERLAFEQPPPFEEIAQRSGLRGNGLSRDAGCCSGLCGRRRARFHPGPARQLPPSSAQRHSGRGTRVQRSQSEGQRGDQAEQADDERSQSMHGDPPVARRTRALIPTRFPLWALRDETASVAYWD